MEEKKKTKEELDFLKETVATEPAEITLPPNTEFEPSESKEIIPVSIETSPLTEEDLQIVSNVQTQVKEEIKPKRGERAKAILREHFSAPRLAYMALFTALAYVVTFLEFPIFPATPFLKLDFSNVFFLIEGFIFGPVEAIVSIGIKECLSLIDSQTAGVGELANFLMSTAFIIVPAIGYRFLKGRKWVALFLVIACAVQIGVSALVNRYINYPFYGALIGFDGAETFNNTWEFVVAFNAIKSVSISVLVFLIYKPLSKFIKATDLRFQKRMQKAKEKRKER